MMMNSMAERSAYLDTSSHENSLSVKISTFCCEENLTQRILYLNQELVTLCYPSILQDYTDTESAELNYVVTLNVMYDLFKTSNRNHEKFRDMAQLQKTTESEAARLRLIINRLKNDLKLKDHALLEKELLTKQYCQRVESLEKKYKLAQEKIKKIMADQVSRDSQFKHDKKKKAQEMEKLQERLQKLMLDKRNDRIKSIEMLNSLQRSDGKRGRWATDKTKKGNEQEMYRMVLTNYEEFQSKLLKENEDMRGYLKSMQNELITALNENSTGRGGILSGSCSSASSTSEISEGMFEMPYELVKDDIDKNLQRKWKALRKVMSTRSSVSEAEFSPPSNEDASDYKRVIKEQQALIEYLTSTKGGERSIPDDCLLLEEKAVLEKDKRRFEQQKQNIEKEKSMLSEAFFDLEVEKQKFEKEKGGWLQQNFLALTPFKDRMENSKNYFHSTKKSSVSILSNQSNTHNNSTVKTPVNSSCISFNSVQEQDDTFNYPYLPSTAELYKKLGLEYSAKLASRSLSTSKNHKQNIEDFHTMVRSSAEKSSPVSIQNSPEIFSSTKKDNSIVRYLEVDSSGNKKHSRSRSAPKEVNYFQNSDEKVPKMERKLYDFTDQKRRTTNTVKAHVDDLKLALFQ